MMSKFPPRPSVRLPQGSTDQHWREFKAECTKQGYNIGEVIARLMNTVRQNPEFLRLIMES